MIIAPLFHRYMNLYTHTEGKQTCIKCETCHVLHAEFTSSKPIDILPKSSYVDVHESTRAMNQDTMRSVLAVHCYGLSWRDFHKYATMLYMLPPLDHMPPRYMDKIERSVEIACICSMDNAAIELHFKVDAIPSAVPKCINIAVSIDSSWKTCGLSSNLGFGSAFSATTKKVLDYALLNSSVRSAIDGAVNANKKIQRPTNGGKKAPSQLLQELQRIEPSQWTWKLQSIFAIEQLINTSSVKGRIQRFLVGGNLEKA